MAMNGRSMALAALLAAGGIWLAACEDESGTRSPDDGGTGGDADGDTDADTDADGDADCSEAAKYVYVVDEDQSFYRFYPMKKNFDLVGKLACGNGGGSPFSMSVARNDTAYVLYQGAFGGCLGIFPVSITTASCGQKTAFKCNTSGFTTFGMGFVTVSDISTNEELYVANSSQVAVLDTNTWAIQPRGALSGDPEFTGNAKGELWGFFPSSSPPQVAQVNKADGTILTSWKLQGLSSTPSAWAFAYWGGSFYIFYQASGEPSTNVYKVTDGVMENYIMKTGKRIVGAGVSTCAPTAPPV